MNKNWPCILCVFIVIIFAAVVAHLCFEEGINVGRGQVIQELVAGRVIRTNDVIIGRIR